MTITIPGAPATVTAQQKGFNLAVHLRGRARGKRGMGWYTKDAVTHEKNRLLASMLVQRPPKPLDGPLVCDILVVFPLTKAQAAKYVDRLSDDSFMIPHTTPPDADNIAKLVKDTLTDARVWVDDARACDSGARKRHGTVPRIVITINRLEEC